MPRRPHEWGAQDWIFVAHALARTRWSEDLDELRAIELIEGIAAYQGVPASELVLQDAYWPAST